MHRGILYYFISTSTLVICGYGIHIGLGRILGPAEYGVFGIVISLSSMSYVFVNNGIQFAVSKHISEKGTAAYPVLKAAIKIQFVFGLSLTLIWVGFADQIAAWLHDASLATYIRFSALAILPLALYEAILGFLNGTKAFGRHALVEICYSISKVVAVFSLVYLGFQVMGAIVGYVIAAICGLVAAEAFSRFQNKSGAFEVSKLIKFSLPVMISCSATSFLMNIDIISVKYLLKDNELVGFYTSASNIARPLWFLSTALGATLLPLISQATSEADGVSTQKYIRQSIRYAAIILFPLTIIVSASAPELVQILYSNRFSSASTPLEVLAFGLLFLSLFTILSTIIAASGRPKTAMAFMLMVIPVDIFLNLLLIPHYRLLGAAWATTTSCFLGMLLDMIYVYRKFHAMLPMISIAKMGVAALFAYLIVANFSGNYFMLPLSYGCGLTLYLIFLLIQKEIKSEEVLLIKNVFSKMKSTSIHTLKKM
jgi:stage V sporulation protein B